MLSRTVIGGETTDQSTEPESQTVEEVKINLTATAPHHNTEIVNATPNSSGENSTAKAGGSQEKTSALSRSLMKHQLVIPNKKAGSSAENSPSMEGEN